MRKVIVFAGTTEGRLLSGQLGRAGIDYMACVATEYGAQVLDEPDRKHVHMGRLDLSGMQQLFLEEHPFLVVDATHPYAVEATKNIRAACRAVQVPYIRLGRERSGEELKQLEQDGRFVFFDTMQEAAAFLERQPGKLFLTVGSKELSVFLQELSDLQRVTVRILPVVENMQHCFGLGLKGSQVICMQGPFSVALNEAMLQSCGAAWLVTKASGRTGGFWEKCEAVRALGIRAAVIRRPVEEEGAALEEAFAKIKFMLGV